MDTKLQTMGRGFAHRADHHRMRVTEHMAAKPHTEIDVLVAIDIDHPGTIAFGDVNRVGHIDGADDLHRYESLGALVNLARSGCTSGKFFVDVSHRLDLGAAEDSLKGAADIRQCADYPTGHERIILTGEPPGDKTHAKKHRANGLVQWQPDA